MIGSNDSASTGSVSDIDDVITLLFRNGRSNAVIAWALMAIMVIVFVESVVDFDVQWIVFVGFVGAVVLLPPLAYRDWRVMLPWELLVLALFPILVRGIVGGTVGTFATYLAIAALSLIVIVEFHMFTSLKVSNVFAVILVTMTTLASVAAWTIFRWNADRLLGTNYLVDNETLMIEWLFVAMAGIVAGVMFDIYFTRRDRILWRKLRQVIR